MRLWAPEARRLQLSFWSGIILVSLALAYLAKARASCSFRSALILDESSSHSSK